jgi:hypothetical protein
MQDGCCFIGRRGLVRQFLAHEHVETVVLIREELGPFGEQETLAATGRDKRRQSG